MTDETSLCIIFRKKINKKSIQFTCSILKNYSIYDPKKKGINSSILYNSNEHFCPKIQDKMVRTLTEVSSHSGELDWSRGTHIVQKRVIYIKKN